MEPSNEHPWGRCEMCGRDGSARDNLDAPHDFTLDLGRLCFACRMTLTREREEKTRYKGLCLSYTAPTRKASR